MNTDTELARKSKVISVGPSKPFPNSVELVCSMIPSAFKKESLDFQQFCFVLSLWTVGVWWCSLSLETLVVIAK
jgi:hypothetical protein